jgi:radical SAM superfamily enzyme YgiQ (UPF0313 family)
MRVVFVDNLLLEHRGGGIHHVALQPHLGLISLRAVAEAAGHQGLLYDPKLALARAELRLDPSLYREAARHILDLEPDVVGLTSLGCNFICTLKIATHLKGARPDLQVLLGGPHATVLARPILERFDVFDVIARNEAELTLPLLLRALGTDGLGDVPGITHRRGRDVLTNPGEPVIADLDTLPMPAYRHYPISELGLTSLNVDAGRGCPFRCTFCSTATHFGRRYRLKSAARLCRELDALQATYGVRHFELTHDLFTVNRRGCGLLY